MRKIGSGGMAGKAKGRDSHWGYLNKEAKKASKKRRRALLKKEALL